MWGGNPRRGRVNSLQVQLTLATHTFWQERCLESTMELGKLYAQMGKTFGRVLLEELTREEVEKLPWSILPVGIFKHLVEKRVLLCSSHMPPEVFIDIGWPKRESFKDLGEWSMPLYPPELIGITEQHLETYGWMCLLNPPGKVPSCTSPLPSRGMPALMIIGRYMDTLRGTSR